MDSLMCLYFLHKNDRLRILFEYLPVMNMQRLFGRTSFDNAFKAGVLNSAFLFEKKYV